MTLRGRQEQTGFVSWICRKQRTWEQSQFASCNEIPLISLRNEGDGTSSEEENLEPILQFFDGNDPGARGRVTRDGLTKVTAMLPEPEPAPFSTTDKPQFVVWLLATVVTSGLSTKVKKVFAGAAWMIAES
jgi:hypothetical protein